MDRSHVPMDKIRRAGQFDRDDRTAEQSLAPFARLLAAIGIALALVLGTFNLAQSLLGPIQGYDFAQFYVAAVLVVDGHDWVHVLAGYGTKVEAELEFFALIARAHDDPRGWSLLAMVVSLCETGYLVEGAGLFEAFPGQLSVDGMTGTKSSMRVAGTVATIGR